MRLIDKLKMLRYRAFYSLIERRRCDLVTLGGECSWTMLPNLSADSRVLCAGAGHDISFELELASRFHCQIHLLDPSPTGKATWTKNKAAAGSKILFHPIALSGVDGNLSLGPPADEVEGSFRSLPKSAMNCISVPARSAPSLMEEWGWDSIDLLKMDIEGGEFAVLDSLRDAEIRVGQICVEFHHGRDFATTGKDSRKAILNLLRQGYRLVHHIHWDHTFVQKSLL